MTYEGKERRKHPRVSGRFIVSYRILEGDDIKTKRDITQTKNVGLGGMLLTTNMQFKPGTNLALEIRLPFDPNPIMMIGKVIESRQVIENLIYDTRLMFLAIDEQHRHSIEQTVQYYTKKEGSI